MDILAEKLRSLLQQKPRNRYRSQDVYDIAEYVRKSAIDRRKIATYLQQKSRIRGIEARKSSFDDEIRDMAAKEYEQRIREEAPRDFIPFDEAWQDVLSLVQSLDIPD
ncbi:MAG: nucleotidyl transferase AbiEii/AbiGii toxin family protein [Planctomycetota bacterium]